MNQAARLSSRIVERLLLSKLGWHYEVRPVTWARCWSVRVEHRGTVVEIVGGRFVRSLLPRLKRGWSLEVWAGRRYVVVDWTPPANRRD